MEVMDYNEEEMQMEEQEQEQEQDTGGDHPVQAENDDDVDNNAEPEVQMEDATCDNKTSNKEAPEVINIDDTEADDVDSDQSCPICMDLWTSSGEHRLCCLRCGHLFGHSCILRWLQTSCTSSNRRCPQCNRKAAVKDIRMLYAKKLTSIDTSELDKLKDQLNTITSEKNRIEMELTKCNLREKLYEQQISSMENRISVLERHQSEMSIYSSHNTSRSTSRKFHLEGSMEICKEGGCRVLDYNPWHKVLVVSQKSTNALFSGYGIRKIDSEKFEKKQFIYLHTQAIRDITFSKEKPSLFLSVSFDKCAKLMDIQNNISLHTYQTEFPLWSCCWSGDNSNIFFAGAQNGSITQFDIRQTMSAVSTLESPGDRSPVVSLATVPVNPGGGIGRGGFIACRLNTCYAYEQKEANYVPKQIFLEGPFVSVCYNEKNNHALISSRPNARQPHARHVVCTIDKGNEDSTDCNIVHIFNAGNSQKFLSRPCLINMEDDTIVAAHQESASSVSLWSISSGEQIHSLPVSDPVVDMCAVEVDRHLFLTTLSAKKIRIYSHG